MLNVSKNLPPKADSSSAKKTTLSSLALAVVLFVVLTSSISSGQKMAQAEAVLRTVDNLAGGLEFFYKDQNRFPSFTEFSSPEIMLNYFSSYPPENFAANSCRENFVYKRIDQQSYTLNFCLPKDMGDFKKGWNTINGKPK